MPQTEKMLDWTYTIAQVPHVGGGDADVYTKPGRTTQVRIEAANLRVGEDRHSVYADVVYEVTELHKNNTQLRWFGPVRIPSPYDSEIVKFVDVSDYATRAVIKGENHAWNDIPINSPSSCVTRVRAKIDGKGDDDTGNAQLEITFHIPVIVKDVH